MSPTWTSLPGTAALALWLAMSCAAPPPTGYAPARDVLPGRAGAPDTAREGYGYRSVELAPAVHRVSYKGDPLTPRERAEDFALLRAAEIALEAGFPHLRVLERADATSSVTHTTTLPEAPVCLDGTCYEPPPTTVTTTATYPAFSLTVAFLRSDSGGEPFVFDARFLFYTLRRQHGLSTRVPADAWYADYSCVPARSGE